MNILESYKALLRAIREEGGEYMEDDMYFMADQVKKFAEYVKTVTDGLFDVALAREKYAGETALLQSVISDCDRKRKIVHDSAISACAVLNRTCARFGVEPFCPDTDDRLVVANFCAKATDVVFWNGVEKIDDIDRAVEKAAADPLMRDRIDGALRKIADEA